jgi:2-phosphoglycerate kinase
MFSAGLEFPYSKGLTARMLVTAGMSPARAYSLACHIENELAAREELAAGYDRVFAVTEAMVEATEGDAVVTRLRRLRELHDLDKPLILLIGGSTGAGKSSVASEVAYRLGITRLASTDFVRQTMRAFFSAEDMPSIHRSSFEVNGIGAESEHMNGDVVDGFMDQADQVLVGVDALIQRALTEGLSMILEGVHLVPGLVSPLSEAAVMVHCLLTVPSEVEHSNRFRVRDSAPMESRPARRYLTALGSIRTIDLELVGRAHREGVPVVENNSIEDTVRAVMDLVLDAVHSRRGRPHEGSVQPLQALVTGR